MKVAIWISKEKMLPVQEKLLKDAGYNIIIYNKRFHLIFRKRRREKKLIKRY